MKPNPSLESLISVRTRFVRGLLALYLLIGMATSGQLFLSVEDREFAPGTIEGVIDIRVSNSGSALPVLGVSLNVQIGDGGIDAGGVEVGPRIVDVDLFGAGALFTQKNNGRGGNGSIIPQIFEVGTLVPQGTSLTLESGNWLLASVTLDLSGLDPGDSWKVFLDTLNGSTVLLDPTGQPIVSTLGSGTVSLTAVPEPGATALVVVTALGGLALLRSRTSRTLAGPEGRWRQTPTFVRKQ